MLSGGCATSSRFRLPEGPGRPLPEYAGAFDAAMTACRRVRVMEAVLAIRGRTGESRIRGQIRAALARPSSLRLEGFGPFGRLEFVLTASPQQAVLVLPRDRQVVTGERPSDLVAALTGLSLDADDLRAVLTGCVVSDGIPIRGRAYPDGWNVVDIEAGGSAYLRMVDDQLVVLAGARPGLFIEYTDHVRGLPRRVEVRTTDVTPATELSATLSQVSLNTGLDARVFRAVPPDNHVPITLDELRQGARPLAGPTARK